MAKKKSDFNWRVFSVLVLVFAVSNLQRAVFAAVPQLATAMKLDTPSVGVSTTPEGRRFLVLARRLGLPGPQLVEWKAGKLSAYPDSKWNSWKPGDDPASAFVQVNAQRIGPDGDLWVVDVGAVGFDPNVLFHGPKLVDIDIASNRVKRVYPLDSVTKQHSIVDDVRFNGRMAYLTDAGQPGLIVLDLASGSARRVLNDAPSTTAHRPLSVEGVALHFPDGRPVMVHADQLEVSPDRKYLYYQAASGPLYRVETRLLDDARMTDAALSAKATLFAKTESTTGTAIDDEGNIYASDSNRSRILKISPDGAVSVVIADARLDWVDAMWIDDQGKLWMPAAQMNRAAVLNGGKSTVELPLRVYTVDIGHKPPASDHR